MFKRSETDKRRVVIVDYNHLVHRFTYGGAPSFTHTVKLNGVPTTIDTTIQTHTIKAIYRWSNKGQNPTAVCFDSPCRCRKGYIAKAGIGISTGAGAGEYKGGRSSLESSVFESITMTQNMMRQAGISCYKADNYEADDLVFAVVKKAKEQYPDLPIDVICNDADLLPLVDEQVSVFFRSVKYTFATDKSIEKTHYVQVTPDNYQDMIQGMTAYKNLIVPYNTLLLMKLLRGDKSDNIAGHKAMKPMKCKKLIADMESDGVLTPDLFTYREMTPICYDLQTGAELTKEQVMGMERGTYRIEYVEHPETEKMFDILSNYLEEDVVDYARKVYRGINLNVPFTDLGEGFNRYPAKITKDIMGYSAGALQQQCSELGIHLTV
jgi:DNA polymerase-1